MGQPDNRSAGGLALFPVARHAVQNGGDDQQKHKADDDGGNIFSNPGKHDERSFPGILMLPDFHRGGELGGFLIGLEQHADDAGRDGEGRDEADHIDVSGEDRADLVDHQRNRVANRHW